jgi:beta-glucosidase-like glycosyl hydrolase
MRAYRKKKSASKAAEDPQETGNEAAADLVIEMTPTSCSLEPVLSKQLRVVTEMGKCENDDGTTRLLQLKARLISNRKPNSEEEKAAMRLLAHCDIQIQLRVHDPSSMRTLGLTVTEDTISV